MNAHYTAIISRARTLAREALAEFPALVVASAGEVEAVAQDRFDSQIWNYAHLRNYIPNVVSADRDPFVAQFCATIQTATAAALLGKRGGSATSDAKRAASRKNGRKGGRPRTPPGTVNTETKRFAARVARVAHYCQTDTTGLADWLAAGYTYENSAREVAAEWDALGESA